MLDADCYHKKGTNIFDILSLKTFLNNEFEILSKEDKKIDISNIEEFKIEYETTVNINTGNASIKLKNIDERNIIEKINEIIKAIKQLDNKIK